MSAVKNKLQLKSYRCFSPWGFSRGFWLKMTSEMQVLSCVPFATMVKNPDRLTDTPEIVSQQNHKINLTTSLTCWMFPKIGVPQNGWFIMENPIKMDDLGMPLFSETSCWVHSSGMSQNCVPANS